MYGRAREKMGIRSASLAAAMAAASWAGPAIADEGAGATGTEPPVAASAVATGAYTAPSEPALRAQPTESHWYGYQNILVDAGSVMLAVVAGDKQSQTLADLALATYVFGSPAVHWGHGHVDKGFGSLGLRVGAPLLGGALGCVADEHHGEFGCLGGAVVGVLVGGAAAMIIDYAVLAREDVPMERATSLRLTPSFALVPDSGRLRPSMGLGGTF